VGEKGACLTFLVVHACAHDIERVVYDRDLITPHRVQGRGGGGQWHTEGTLPTVSAACAVYSSSNSNNKVGESRYHTTTPDATEASKWTNTPSWSPAKPGGVSTNKIEERRLRNKCVVVDAADNNATMERYET
jgi:hypothetical protein